jgi:hypothetical protein
MSIFQNPTTQLLTPYSVNLSGNQDLKKRVSSTQCSPDTSFQPAGIQQPDAIRNARATQRRPNPKIILPAILPDLLQRCG